MKIEQDCFNFMTPDVDSNFKYIYVKDVHITEYVIGYSLLPDCFSVSEEWQIRLAYYTCASKAVTDSDEVKSNRLHG